MARSERARLSVLAVLVVAVCLFGVSGADARQYAERRAAAVKACEAIDPSESRSGLLFNPEGHRSYYVRSRCLQDAAVQYRDPTLCAQVRQRSSLFGSSWGYSAERCRNLVSEGAAADRNELEQMKRAYTRGAVQLRDFRIARNGNGRDVEIIPAFAGDYAHGYTLTFEILQGGGAMPIFLHTSGYHLDATSNLIIYVPQAEIRQRFPGFALNQSYPVRATVTLEVGNGGQAGYWSEAFIERVFPVRERSHSITRQAVF